MKRFVIADIHGRIEALKEVLKASKFSYSDDILISLGDECDGGYNTKEVIDELLKIKHLVLCASNHNDWFLKHISEGFKDEIWIQQGGANTLRSYGAKVKEADYMTNRSLIDTKDLIIPVTHQDYLNRAVDYHIEDKMLFCHGGFLPDKGVENTPREILLWDRDLIRYAKNGNIIKGYDKVFIGHTTTQMIEDTTKPVRYGNLYMLDTGAGNDGKLTIWNIDTEKYWQSREQKSLFK